MDENNLIRKITTAMKGATVSHHFPLPGIGDDAALLRVRPNHDVILSCDWFLEGSHFLADEHPADSVGWKCLARALSDIAAMGGTPACFLLSLALPSSRCGRWLEEFLGGLRRASRKFACPLAGGDTTWQTRISISVTVVGQAGPRTPVLRSGAHPGDILFVSGRLGEAELGLRALKDVHRKLGPKHAVLQKHLYPEPRLALGRWLAEKRLASAMMDLSDGLSSDLPRLCDASKVGAVIHAAQIPLPRATTLLKSMPFDPLQLALHGGDDYELLFTIPRGKTKYIPSVFRGLSLTAIGVVTKNRKILLRDHRGHQHPVPKHGWDPFRRR